jgi:short-subunit dehydrogenase
MKTDSIPRPPGLTNQGARIEGGQVTGRNHEFVRRFGPWAVVTGASEGIGEAFARQLAARGMNLVLVARRAEWLAALSAELAAEHGVETVAHVADLTGMAAVQQLADDTARLDVGLLIAAAGFGTSGPLLDSGLDGEVEMVALNCASVMAQTWHFGRRFAARRRGGIVLLSSLLGFCGVPRAANYAATKAYVQSLAEGLRSELSASGVDVIASAPGPVHSGFARRANMRMALAVQPDVVARVTLDCLGRKTTVRPGALSKLLGWSLATAPRRVQILILGQVMKSMTSHQVPARVALE